MLTAATRQFLEQSSERTFLAHVIRAPAKVGGAHVYYMGISLEDGTPIGMVTSATGEVLREWKRFAAIEDFLAIAPERLISINLYPVTCAEPAVIDMLIDRYALDQKNDLPMLESERERLLAALQSARSTNASTQDTADS